MKNSSELMFTIVIPTRDRFHNVVRTIESVISQEADKFEIVVSDNSIFEKGKLKSYLKSLVVPSKCILNFYETEKDLPMPENWESASLKSRGEYTLILADRWVMLPGTLSFLKREVSQKNPEVAFWDVNNPDISLNANGNFDTCDSFSLELNSKEILKNILKYEGYKDDTVFKQKFPRGINSMYRADVAKSFRKKHGPLFSKYSCDYTSGIGLLMESNKCLDIKVSLYSSIGLLSNGHKVGVYGKMKYYDDEDLNIFNWRGLEFDSVFLTVLNDIERTISLNPVLKDELIPRIDVMNVLLSLLTEIHYKEFHGSLLDTNLMRQKIFEFIKDYPHNNFLDSEKIVKYDQLKRPRWVALRRLFRRLGIFEIILAINNVIRYGANPMSIFSSKTDLE